MDNLEGTSTQEAQCLFQNHPKAKQEDLGTTKQGNRIEHSCCSSVVSEPEGKIEENKNEENTVETDRVKQNFSVAYLL